MHDENEQRRVEVTAREHGLASRRRPDFKLPRPHRRLLAAMESMDRMTKGKEFTLTARVASRLVWPNHGGLGPTDHDLSMQAWMLLRHLEFFGFVARTHRGRGREPSRYRLTPLDRR